MTWRQMMDEASAQGWLLDWITASDDDPVRVVACLFRDGDLRLESAEAPVESVADIFAAARWHERETAQMFGIEFGGGLDHAPLFDVPGAVLRKAYPLPPRQHEWPGAQEPSKPQRRIATPGTPWT